MAASAEAKERVKAAGHDEDDIEGEHNEWKFNEPYKIHKNKFNALYEASCHCGRVRYQLSREKPLDAKFCHCHTCQVLHGALFQWAAIFHKSDVNFTHGHHDLSWYDPGEKTTRHKLPCKVSCSYCRAPIMDEGRNMILLFPSLIQFKSEEEKKKFMPSCHIFYSRRLIDINDGLPKWTEMKDKSELIADSPTDAIKKRKREIKEEAEEKDEKKPKNGGDESGGKKKNGSGGGGAKGENDGE